MGYNQGIPSNVAQVYTTNLEIILEGVIVKTKKLLVMLLLVVSLLGTITGCGKKVETGDANSVDAGETDGQDAGADASTEKKELRLMYYWENATHQATLDRVIKDYNASQDSVSVKAEYVPFADFKKQLSIGVTAGELPDLVILDNPDHAAYASMGIFADLTEKLADWDGLSQYYEGPLNSAKLDGKLYGVPFGSNCLALYYNEDMLKAAGVSVPTTWDELKDAAVKLSHDNVDGFAMSSVQNEEGTFTFAPWLWSTGATSFDVNNENGIKALTLVKDLVDSGAMSKEVINWTQGDVMNQFISGNAAMMVNGPWQIGTMKSEAPDLNWNVALLPKDAQYSSVLGGENIAAINGDNVDQAVDFIKFITSPEELKTYINDFGYIASRKDVAETQFKDDPIMSVFTEEMKYAAPRGPHQYWPQISDAISTALNKVIVGASTPADAAAEAQTTIDEVLKK